MCQIGAYKYGTTITGHNVAEIIVVLKSMPTKKSCKALARKVKEGVEKINPTDMNRGEQTDDLAIEFNDEGFDVFNSQARVCVLITALQINVYKLNPKTHLDADKVNDRLFEISCEEENLQYDQYVDKPSAQLLIRILCDVIKRFEGFRSIYVNRIYEELPFEMKTAIDDCIFDKRSTQPFPIDIVFHTFIRNNLINGSCHLNKPNHTVSGEENAFCGITAEVNFIDF